MSEESSVRATAASETPVAIGEVLADKYRVERIVGEGAMGVVVEATHLELHKRFALKFMKPAAISNNEGLERFLREARAAGRLQSIHACHVSDVGRLASGSPFIVMELLDGEDLHDRLVRTGPFSIAEVVRCMLQVCDAIGEAHRLGIIHRDLKPQNLFCVKRPTGEVLKVLDFGVSKMTAPNDHLTTANTAIIGTPNFMSPEQLSSSTNVDGRTDIWAMGVIMYQLLTGKLPFDGEDFLKLCVAVSTKEPPPPSTLRSDGDDRLDAIVLRCLAKERVQRFATAEELGAMLEPLRDATPSQRLPVIAPDVDRTDVGMAAHAVTKLDSHESVPDPVAPRSRSKLWLGVAVAVGLGGGLVALKVTSKSSKATEPIAAGSNTGSSAGSNAVAPPDARVVEAPAPTGTPREQARELARRAQLTAARNVLERAITGQHDPAVRLELADISFELGRVIDAKRHLAELRPSKSKLADTDRARAEALEVYLGGDLKNAAMRYRELFDKEPSLENARQLVQLYLETGQADKAEHVLDDLDSRSPDDAKHPVAFMIESTILQATGRDQEALVPLERAAKAAHDRGFHVLGAKIDTWLSYVLANVDRLAPALEAALRAKPVFENADERAELGSLHNSLGIIYWLMNEHTKALVAFDASLELYEQASAFDFSTSVQMNRTSALMWMGRGVEMRRDMPAIRQQLDATMGKFADTFSAWERLGAGDVKAAHTMIAKVIGSGDTPDPRTNVLAHYVAGSTDFALGNLAAARSNLDAALTRTTDLKARAFESLVRARLADIDLAEGKLADAEAQARKAIAHADTANIRDAKIESRLALRTALARQNRAADAAAVDKELAALVSQTDNLFVAHRVRIHLATQAKDTAALEAVAAEARKLELVGVANDAEVQQGLLELAAPATAARGKERLEAALAVEKKLGRTPRVQAIKAALGA